MKNFFDEDYYERGLQTGKSCYQNYRWIPELTIPLAMTLIDYLKISRFDTVLDYGCSKGYLVKAFRLLYRQTWGVDVSEYAIENVPEDVKDFCYNVKDLCYDITFDYCIAKDVFEHIQPNELAKILNILNAKVLFVVVPLGKDGKYYAEINNLDVSHVVCEDEDWWMDFFYSNGWKLLNFSFQVDGIKESYKSIPKAHGFFTLERF